MIQKNDNFALNLCFVVFLKISICMIVLAMTTRLLLGLSQLMSFLRLTILVLCLHAS